MIGGYQIGGPGLIPTVIRALTVQTMVGRWFCLSLAVRRVSLHAAAYLIVLESDLKSGPDGFEPSIASSFVKRFWRPSFRTDCHLAASVYQLQHDAAHQITLAKQNPLSLGFGLPA